MKQVVTIQQRAIESEALKHCDIPDFLKRVYHARGIEKIEQADLGLDHLTNDALLPGRDKALALLVPAREKQSRLLIVGDYDADGTVGTVLLCKALSRFGYAHVDYLIPDRFRYGYGLSPAIVEQALQKEPEVLITVDNGITSYEGVALAKAAGVQVIVTDHHLPAATLPDAAAIVNPHLDNAQFRARNLAGVGVAFYLMIALRSKLVQLGYFDSREVRMDTLLDLVAIGTIADVVALDQDNRILVAQGLARIRKAQCSPGVLALLQVAKREPAQVLASDLGFVIGPYLNAVGRLENTAAGIACLLHDRFDEAVKIAAELKRYNLLRKEIESQMCREAFAQMQEEQKRAAAGICVMQADWHEGVVGIVAARLRDRFARPAVVFAPGDEDNLRGSARSIGNLDIRALLAQMAQKDPKLISAFGGHQMAAGLTLPKAHFDRFRTSFEAEVACLNPCPETQILSDGCLPPESICLETAQQIQNMPWGKGFPEPLFEGEFQVLDKRILADRHLKLLLCSGNDHNHQWPAIFFNLYNEEKINPVYRCEFDRIENTINVVYYLRTDSYSGFCLHLKYIQPKD